MKKSRPNFPSLSFVKPLIWVGSALSLETEADYTHSLANTKASYGHIFMPRKSPQMSFYLVHVIYCKLGLGYNKSVPLTNLTEIIR